MDSETTDEEFMRILEAHQFLLWYPRKCREILPLAIVRVSLEICGLTGRQVSVYTALKGITMLTGLSSCDVVIDQDGLSITRHAWKEDSPDV